jgi:hypothetical protein
MIASADEKASQVTEIFGVYLVQQTPNKHQNEDIA